MIDLTEVEKERLLDEVSSLYFGLFNKHCLSAYDVPRELKFTTVTHPSSSGVLARTIGIAFSSQILRRTEAFSNSKVKRNLGVQLPYASSSLGHKTDVISDNVLLQEGNAHRL